MELKTGTKQVKKSASGFSEASISQTIDHDTNLIEPIETVDQNIEISDLKQRVKISIAMISEQKKNKIKYQGSKITILQNQLN